MKAMGIIPSFTMGGLYPFAKVCYGLHSNEVGGARARCFAAIMAW
jgi:hypothetical protein